MLISKHFTLVKVWGNHHPIESKHEKKSCLFRVPPAGQSLEMMPKKSHQQKNADRDQSHFFGPWTWDVLPVAYFTP